jgi:hypothetical protein
MNFLIVSFLLYFWHVIFHFVFHLIIRTIQFPTNLSKMDDISSYFKNRTESYGKISLEYIYIYQPLYLVSVNEFSVFVAEKYARAICLLFFYWSRELNIDGDFCV